MNKKRISYIIAVVLCLNLLTQTSNAFTGAGFVLNETKDALIYDNEDEKLVWENGYLQGAKILKMVNKTMTMLEIAKIADKDDSDHNILSEIINCTEHMRQKLLVKWERDKGYIDKEEEKNFGITPATRLRLLAEIREEEEKEKKERSQFWWKITKAVGAIGAFGVTFVVAKWVNRDIKKAGKLATILASAATTLIIVMEAGLECINRFFPKDLTGDPIIKTKDDLIELPSLPQNYKRVDVYSYGL